MFQKLSTVPCVCCGAGFFSASCVIWGTGCRNFSFLGRFEGYIAFSETKAKNIAKIFHNSLDKLTFPFYNIKMYHYGG